jgi:hypothetical protein
LVAGEPRWGLPLAAQQGVARQAVFKPRD